MRLPRAEDPAVLFIDVDGEAIRAEGIVRHVRLSQGVDLLRGTLAPVGPRRVRGEITITLSAMVAAAELEDPSSPESIDVLDGEGNVVQVIVVEEGRDALPPGS